VLGEFGDDPTRFADAASRRAYSAPDAPAPTARSKRQPKSGHMLSDGRRPCAEVEDGAAAEDRAADGDGIGAEAPPWLHTSATTQDAALPPDDRSFDRNEQHHAALEHHQRTVHTHITPSD